MGIPWRKLLGRLGKWAVKQAQAEALNELQRRADRRKRETLVAVPTGTVGAGADGKPDAATGALYGEDLED